MPSAQFIDSLQRQNDITRHEFTVRVSIMSGSFALALLYGDLGPLALFYLLYLMAEFSGLLAMRHLDHRFARVWYSVLMCASFTSSACTMALAVYVGSQSQTGADLFGLGLVAGAIIHVIVVRSFHFPITIAILVPMMTAALFAVSLDLRGETDGFRTLLAYGIVVILFGYAGWAILEMHRMRQNLFKARDRAEQASRSKSRFVASMSHEIRTPLNGILGVAQLALEDARSDAARDRAEILYSSALTLKALVDDVLDHAKIEAGKMDIRPVPTDLRHLMNTVVQLFGDLAKTKGNIQRVTVAPDIPELIIVDSLRLRQILSNLMSNAIKFTDNGEITLAAKVLIDEARPTLCIDVNDTGQGMSVTDQSRLFVSFSQVDNDAERAAVGSGLGLVISRNLARMMSGDLTVQSALKKGTQFRLIIPLILPDPIQADLTSDAPTPDHVNALAALSLTAQRVLLVDDNRANRMIARTFMEKAQIYVIEADSGTAAIQKLKSQPFDLVLMDMHMPDMTGLETLEVIRQLKPPLCNLPVIALTADAAPEDREFYLGAGLDGYLAKPLSKTDLFHEIERVLRQHAVNEVAAE